MHFVGQLSRPSSRLQAILDFETPVAKSSESILPSPNRQRLGNGVVQRAIIGVLAEAGEPMPIAVIHAAVERRLGQSVSMDSVSWCLRMDVKKGEGGRFERTSYGVYRLC